MATPSAKIPPQLTPRTYLVTLWAEPQTGQGWVWRGFLQRADGTRIYFRTLAELNQWVREWGGWNDPSEDTPAIAPS